MDETKRDVLFAIFKGIKSAAADDTQDFESIRRLAHAAELVLCDMSIENERGTDVDVFAANQ